MTPEQQALLQKTRDSIGSAKLQVSNDYREVSISRAHYAMFYLAEVLLLIDSLAPQIVPLRIY